MTLKTLEDLWEGEEPITRETFERIGQEWYDRLEALKQLPAYTGKDIDAPAIPLWHAYESPHTQVEAIQAYIVYFFSLSVGGKKK